MTPVLTDLGDVAPDVNRLILQLGPFSRAAIPAFDTLGDAAVVGTPAVIAARPVITELRRSAVVLRPVARDLSAVLRSFRRNQGIERAMDYILYQVTAINGFDGVGHYLRAGLIVNQCASYAVEPAGGCSANFRTPAAATASNAEPAPQPVATPAPVAAPAEQATAAPAPAPAAAPPSTPEQQALMDYLFGRDG
jgi:phospholipid/cholesterol/gamma-HCH transport system substrate-binding protein